METSVECFNMHSSHNEYPQVSQECDFIIDFLSAMLIANTFHRCIDIAEIYVEPFQNESEYLSHSIFHISVPIIYESNPNQEITCKSHVNVKNSLITQKH